MQSSFFITLGVYIVILFNPSSIYAQNTISVPADYPTIQEALNSATADATINVAPGIYLENLIWPAVDGIKLIGVEGRDSTIIDGNLQDRVITISHPITYHSRIDGFTIQNGRISNNPTNIIEGAGIYSDESSISLSNLTIQNNYGEGSSPRGCGAYLNKYDGRINNCIFQNNVIDGGLAASGVGLYIHVREYAQISNCQFNNNQGTANNSTNGSGIFAIGAENSVLNILKSSLTNNTANSPNSSSGGGIYIGNSFLKVSLDSCYIATNSAENGGGIYNVGGNLNIVNGHIESNRSFSGSAVENSNYSNENLVVRIENSYFNMNNIGTSVIYCIRNTAIIILNSVFKDNSSRYTIETSTEETKSLEIYNSTFAYNRGPIYLRDVNFKSINSVFWNPDYEEIKNGSGSVNTINFQNCLVRNGHEGENILSSDPLFISEELLIPSENSPCLGAGTLEFYPDIDLDGNNRPMPLTANPDIGAYEVDETPTSTSLLKLKDLSLFPNPTDHTLNFSKKVNGGRIYAINGTMIKSFGNSQYIDVSSLKNGIYFIEMELEGEVWKEKFTVLK